METLQTFTTLVTIVSIVFGILNIILFFKIWGMTENVKRMLNIMERINRESIQSDNIAQSEDSSASYGGANHDMGGKLLIGFALVFIIVVIIILVV